jgi:hypothetical protein
LGLDEPGILADLQAKYPAFGRLFAECLLKDGREVEYAPCRRSIPPQKVSSGGGGFNFAEMRKKAEHNVQIRFPTKARALPGMFEALKAKAKAAKERTEALQRDVKTTYDEFLALDLDVTSLSTADQADYREIMDTLRRQRVPLEFRRRSIIL